MLLSYHQTKFFESGLSGLLFFAPASAGPSAWYACRHLVNVKCGFFLLGGLPYELTEGDIICVFSQ